MKTHTFTMNVVAEPASGCYIGDANEIGGVIYNLYGFDVSNKCGTAVVTVTLNDDFDPVRQFVKNLEEEKRKVTEAFTKKLAEINEQIKKFTALEMS